VSYNVLQFIIVMFVCYSNFGTISA